MFHGLLEFRHAHLQEVGLTQDPADHYQWYGLWMRIRALTITRSWPLAHV